jgi:hypothetical protein
MKWIAAAGLIALVIAASGPAFAQRARPSLDSRIQRAPIERPDRLDIPSLDRDIPSLDRDIPSLDRDIEPRIILPEPSVQGAPVKPDAIEVTNFGNKTLSFTYWNGEGAWEVVKLLPTQGTTITCQACGATIQISYNDGRGNRKLPAQTGGRYFLYWLASENRWNFGPNPPR